MGVIKWKKDSALLARRKSRIAQLRARKAFRRNIARIVIHSMAWLGAAVCYYFAISFFFDTPYEYALSRSSNSLRSQYNELEARYDSLQSVLTNIEARDENIFNIMFESKPYDLVSEAENKRIQLREAMLNMTPTELRDELDYRCDMMEDKVTLLQSRTSNMVANIETARKKRLNIPAIQPIANSQLSLLTASYGMRVHPFYKTIQPHLGIDYTIPEGTRVFATADGVVKNYVTTNATTTTSGMTITIEHGNGYQTSYGHLSKILVDPSQRVRRGDIIGLSGNTGLSLTPHLHYEVTYRNEKVDPIHYFFMELSPDGYQRIMKIAQSGMQSFD
ncbi:MAG: M23 family metallopeptidase [Rikenellaceae bacterium]